MKRIIASIMALTLIACVFAACGKKADDKKTTTEKATVATKQDDVVFADYYDNTVTLKNGETTSIKTDDVGSKGDGITIEYGCKQCHAGNIVMIKANGTKNAEFSIALYNADHTDVVADGFENVKSNSDGVISFSFKMPENASVGTKLMVIREVGTENYVSLPINVIE